VIPAGQDGVISARQDRVIPAAGALPWRRQRAQLQVALVHRPRYDDWSWPKGKLDDAEEWPVAAAREVFEETGFQVRLGRPLPSSEYPLRNHTPGALTTEDQSTGDHTVGDHAVEDQTAGDQTAGAHTTGAHTTGDHGTGAHTTGDNPAGEHGTGTVTKQVRYWSAEVVGGDGTLVNEIDEVAWLDVAEAAARLSYAHDHQQLRALVRADHAWTLATWPLILVRHAKSQPRSRWSEADPLRPLDDRGLARAEALVPILAAYGVTRVVTSTSVRCLDTILPYAVAAGHGTRLRAGLSEEGFAAQPERAPHHLTRLLEHGDASVICTHGPILPVLLGAMARITRSDASAAKTRLTEAAQHGLGKGEALVAHVVGTGSKARIVDVERYPAR
jgi:8-oxo-dGTP pyrophosphatase MutT (NUDIX family)/phosphohistidine phosphatase SixA